MLRANPPALRPHFGRAGEKDGVYVRMADEGSPCPFIAVDNVHHPRGKTGLVKKLGQPVADEGGAPPSLIAS